MFTRSRIIDCIEEACSKEEASCKRVDIFYTKSNNLLTRLLTRFREYGICDSETYFKIVSNPASNFSKIQKISYISDRLMSADDYELVTIIASILDVKIVLPDYNYIALDKLKSFKDRLLKLGVYDVKYIDKIEQAILNKDNDSCVNSVGRLFEHIFKVRFKQLGISGVTDFTLGKILHLQDNIVKQVMPLSLKSDLNDIRKNRNKASHGDYTYKDISDTQLDIVLKMTLNLTEQLNL